MITSEDVSAVRTFGWNVFSSHKSTLLKVPDPQDSGAAMTQNKEVHGSWPDLQKKPSTCCPFSKVGSWQRQAWQDIPQQCSPGPPGGAWASPRTDGLRTEQRLLWLSRVSNCRVNVHMWKPTRDSLHPSEVPCPQQHWVRAVWIMWIHCRTKSCFLMFLSNIKPDYSAERSWLRLPGLSFICWC